MPLLKLGFHCLIDVQIAAIKAVYKNPEILLCCGFESDKVVRYVRNKYPSDNIRIVENQLFDETNCCETLRLCLNNTTSDSMLVCNGDLLLYPEIVKVIRDLPYVLTQKKGKKKSTLEVGTVCDENFMVTNMSFGLPNLWTEIFHLNSKECINTMRKIVSSDNFKNRLIFEALNSFNETKHSLTQITSAEKVVKINNVQTYHQVRDKYENLDTQLFLRNLH